MLENWGYYAHNLTMSKFEKNLYLWGYPDARLQIDMANVRMGINGD